MRLGKFDNPHLNQPLEHSGQAPAGARLISRQGGRLLRSPLAIVILVWGFLFLILGVALACAQDAGQGANQRRTAGGNASGSGSKRTEAVEIFSAGEDLVVQQQTPAVKASSRRHKIAARRRARR